MVVILAVRPGLLVEQVSALTWLQPGSIWFFCLPDI